MRSRKDQSIFDIATQNFGQLDELVKFARDNDFDFKEAIPVDQELVIDNPVGTGNENNKDAIELQELTFNNANQEFVADGIGAWIIEDTFIVQ